MKRRIYHVSWLFAIVLISACGERQADRETAPLHADSGAAAAGNATQVMHSSVVDGILLYRDSSGVPGELVEGFRSGDNPLHAVIQLGVLEQGTKVGAEWVAVDAGGEKEYTVTREDLTADLRGSTANFTVSLPRPWPTGTYRIDVYLNDRLARSREFEIGAGSE